MNTRSLSNFLYILRYEETYILSFLCSAVREENSNRKQTLRPENLFDLQRKVCSLFSRKLNNNFILYLPFDIVHFNTDLNNNEMLLVNIKRT